ncbi:hypothetical protein HB364_12640 [Pseudoflavitalea sp. X16]|uniref:hypothetical protein n=1 Tax=Paraflavitalea devenefica TaxID=2716334 RepID=UPI001421C914|nr:hypothetical protein [Paraflavitalea devenefica]NII25935.1 hypothetical protein [Paraflavitalea devenefica]
MLKKISLVAAIAIAAAATITSCKKSDSLATLPAPTGTAVALPAEGDSVDFEDAETKGYLKGLADGAYGARNFHQGTVQDLTDTNQWATKAGTYYYSFDDNDGLSGAGISSYSFKFTGSATADLTVDTSRFTLRYINTAFGSVTSTTGSTLIASGVASYNSITGVGNPAAAGWYVYSLVNHTVVAYTPRTYLLTKKSTNEVWKLRINSIYYNATPVGSPYPTNYPYFSFDYKHL